MVRTNWLDLTPVPQVIHNILDGFTACDYISSKFSVHSEVLLFAFVSDFPLFCEQCHSESSRSEDVSSDGEEEEEEDSPSLSPSSSHSCSRADHSAPQSDSSAPGSLPLEGANFLSATPAQWSVEEVCRFISSLQGGC